MRRNSKSAELQSILDGTQRVIAAVGICGPSTRLNEESIATNASIVADVAKELSAHLGFVDSDEPSMGSTVAHSENRAASPIDKVVVPEGDGGASCRL